MKCPNCTFDIQDGTANCPFCNVAIDQAAAKSPIVDRPANIGSSAPTPLPTPLAEIPTKAVADGGEISAGDAVEDYQPRGNEEPLAEEPPRTAGGSKGALKNVLALGAFAAVAFALFKFGALDNILIPLGLKAPPKPAALPVAQASVQEPALQAPVEKVEVVESKAPVPVKAQAPKLAPIKKPPPVKPQEWWFYGEVYELTTLRPARRITLLFLGDGDEISVRTDSNGQYKIRVPIPEEVVGYEVLLDSTRYADDYLFDSNGRIRGMSARARNQLRTTTKNLPPWTGLRAEWLRRDLVLIPL